MASAGELPTVDAARAAASTSSDPRDNPAFPFSGAAPAPVPAPAAAPAPLAVMCGEPWTSHSSSHNREVSRPPRRSAASCCTSTTSDNGSIRCRRCERPGHTPTRAWVPLIRPVGSPRFVRRRRLLSRWPLNCSQAASATRRTKTPVTGRPRCCAFPLEVTRGQLSAHLPALPFPGAPRPPQTVPEQAGRRVRAMLVHMSFLTRSS